MPEYGVEEEEQVAVSDLRNGEIKQRLDVSAKWTTISSFFQTWSSCRVILTHRL